MRKIVYQIKVDGSWTQGKPWPIKPRSRKKKKVAAAPTVAVHPFVAGLIKRYGKSWTSVFYKSREWAVLRYKALKKHSGRCQLCGRTAADGSVISVDHIKPIRKYPHLAMEETNLQVLCRVCNRGKGSWDETAWPVLAHNKEWAGLTPIKD